MFILNFIECEGDCNRLNACNKIGDKQLFWLQRPLKRYEPNGSPEGLGGPL
jgi:hypothetical protein